LTETNRRDIVEKLAGGEATFNTLAQPLKMSLSGAAWWYKATSSAAPAASTRSAFRT